MTTYLKQIFALVAALLLAGCDLLGDLDFLPSKPDGGDDAPLTTSPERLSLVSPQSGMELEYGESVDVTFMVEAYSPVTGRYWACEDAAVVFETESGELSEGVAISDDKGMVSVTWSPTATRAATKSHTLYARIYSSDGAIIDEATFVVKTEDNRDRDILVKFYEDTGGDNWTRNGNWCSDLPLSEWYGVKTNYEGRVVGLRLEENNLTGGGSLSGLDALEMLDCRYNQLTTLDVSGCTSLRELDCYYNQLTTLDVSGCTALKDLDCFGNQLTTLDVLDCTALERLSCSGNQLTTLDVSGCTSLEYLDCDYNQLTTLDVSDYTSLEGLSCRYNQLTTLDVSGCTALRWIECRYNQLTKLDVSGCTALKRLDCRNNRITREISGIFAELDDFLYDSRYTDYWRDYDGNWHWTDNGVGWWWPGEPYSGPHD